jgi:LDH2 family malate/lactate/ureidoglycolate dehydrogenase
MRLTIAQARELAIGALKRLAFSDQDAAITADHLVGAATRGVTFGGLPRILAIKERFEEFGDRRQPIRVTHETAQSATVDGGDNVGYVVAHRVAQMAVDKARRHGMAIVGANNTYYTGIFAHYIEMATRENLIAMAAGNGPAMTAPHGAREPRLGTNPIAWGFPTNTEPIIWDIGTSTIMQGELMMHARLGEEIAEGIALDSEGKPTRDPTAALRGAILAWGGHRGSGLSIVVQLLGILCDTPAIPVGMQEMGFLYLAIDPELLMPVDRFKARASELAASIRNAAPVPGGGSVRVPFDGSIAHRKRALAEDAIDLPDRVYQSLVALRDRA